MPENIYKPCDMDGIYTGYTLDNTLIYPSEKVVHFWAENEPLINISVICVCVCVFCLLYNHICDLVEALLSTKVC